MTRSEYDRLDRLRKNEDFAELTIEAMIYEAVICADEEEVRMMIDDVVERLEELKAGEGR